MRVEITEKKLKDGGYDLVEGDTITVSDELGEKWCSHGWAKDTEGNVPTGERKVIRGQSVNPKKARHPGTEREG